MQFRKNRIKFSSFEWILIGVLIYEFGLIFEMHSMPTLILCVFGLLIIFHTAIYKLPLIMPFTGVNRILFIIYLVWNLLIVLRSLVSTGLSGFSPFNQFGWPSLLIPLVLFVGIKKLSLTSIFKFSYIYGIVGVLMILLNLKGVFTSTILVETNYQEYITSISKPYVFLISTAFMILCYSFIPFNYRVIAIFGMIISTYLTLIAARRGGLFMNVLYLVFFIYLFFKFKRSNALKTILLIIVLLFVISFIFKYQDTIFKLLFTRLSDNTRAPMEGAYFKSFRGEVLDWLFGRGLNGTYYCTLFDDTNFKYRGIIETGYLYIILKGGIVSLIFYIYFLLNSAYVGFFRTNNLITRAMALYLVAHVIYLVPFGLPSFSLEYVIVWVCVLYCQSKIWRNKSDIDIKRYLGFNLTIKEKLKR